MSRITLPGLIDPHVHLRDPGQTEKEDFFTGTSAALAGGFTTILDMPNNKVPMTTEDRLNEKIKEAKKRIVCDIGFYFGSLGDNFEEFKKVEDKVFGLKLYLNITTGHFLINEKQLKEIYNAWISSLSSSRMRGSNKQRHVNNWIPAFAGMTNNLNDLPILVHSEEDTVDKVLKVVKKTGQKTHFCHVSNRDELFQIIKAKENNLPVTCGATPHHLFLTEDDIRKLKGFGMMKPPLKTKKDVEFLWRNLNYIDVIESDHAPHTRKDKLGESPAFGVPGLETTLALLLKAEKEKRISLERIIELCYTNPARIFRVKTDEDTKIEVDIDRDFMIEDKNLKTKCGWTPFEGFKARGKVARVFIRNKKVYENEKILAKPGFGKVVNPYLVIT